MRKWNFYTSKEIKPTGWLKEQLTIQAKGLSGNLDKIWPDIRDSAWIGGDKEGWERVPYWLDGFIPLAYLLEDEDMISRAKKYIDAILSYQKEDGWICPCKDEDRAHYDTWAIQLISKVLTVYYDCSGDERIPAVLYRVLKNYYDLLKSGEIKLYDWGKARWFECFIAIKFTYTRYPEEWLKDLAIILKEQGTDYSEHIEKWKRPINKWTFETHIVNIGMMLKAEALVCDFLGEEYTDKTEELHSILREYNGTAIGLFTGDECLSGLNPIQGTELCAVAEQMYSYEHLFAYTGDNKWAERLEDITFNGIPATISEDMWTHQYDQLSNQIACIKFPGKPIFRTNGEESHLFGLEPNYGCCTANFNQAWPKFALAAYMYNGNDIINTIPVPCTLETANVKISLKTDYPFNNSFKYIIDSKVNFNFTVRIPSFAENPTVNGNSVENGDVVLFVKGGTVTEINVSYTVSPRFIDRPNGLKSVKMGSLVFSLPISHEKKILEYERDGVERKFPYCDYELIPTSDWNYGFGSEDLVSEYHGITSAPFSETNPPITIKAKMQKINWGLEDGYEYVCTKVPESTEPVSEEEEIALYPYGCAKLRMTEMPFIK